jgi:hypothetical protein
VSQTDGCGSTSKKGIATVALSDSAPSTKTAHLGSKKFPVTETAGEILSPMYPELTEKRIEPF